MPSPLNRSTPDFVRKFLTCWMSEDLHVPHTRSTQNAFTKFVKKMQFMGEYLGRKPKYSACYTFFMLLDPGKWSESKKRKLNPVLQLCEDVFTKRKIESGFDDLMESRTSMFMQYDSSDLRDVWENINHYRQPLVSANGKLDAESHPVLLKKLDILFRDQQEFPETLTDTLLCEFDKALNVHRRRRDDTMEDLLGSICECIETTNENLKSIQ